LAKSFGSDEFESLQNICFIFNEEFGAWRNAERSLAKKDFPYFAADSGIGEFLFDLLDF
jgi:hypothetical protein